MGRLETGVPVLFYPVGEKMGIGKEIQGDYAQNMSGKQDA